MTRIAIRSNDDRASRICDIVMDESEVLYIETKRPRQSPVRLPLADMIQQINEEYGEPILYMLANES